MSERIREAVQRSGAHLVRLRIYALPALAPSVVVVTMRPAHFLRDSIQRVFQSYTGSSHSHLLVLDPLGRLVVEHFLRLNGGSVYVGKGYDGCGPLDWGPVSRSCRGDGWPFD
jgi:hypothetical protein